MGGYKCQPHPPNYNHRYNMLTVAIFTWYKDLLIQPCPEQEPRAALEWCKEKKRKFGRMGDYGVEFILFDSGYVIPLDWDGGLLRPNEEQMVEIYQNSWKRPRIWDEDESEAEGGGL